MLRVKDIKEITSLLTDSLIVEEIYDQKKERFLFAVYDNCSRVSYKESIQVEGVLYKPLKSALIKKSVILLPTKAEEYHSTPNLIAEIKNFIHRYYQYSETLELLDSYFVLHSWNYSKFAITPYRRILGDYGTGKTRFLKVIGSICYRPMFLSSVSSEASIYRVIDAYKGTLIIDEADFSRSNLYSTITKILNAGYQRGYPIIKCNSGIHELEAFDIFCPKIVASRQRYSDEALESRCITTETEICTRPDIPKALNSKFDKEAQSLRNKLLLYKFRTLRQEVSTDKTLDTFSIEPRLKEIIIPIISTVENKVIKGQLYNFTIDYQKSIIQQRGLSLAKLILETIIQLQYKQMPLAVGIIASAVQEKLSLREIIRKTMRVYNM